MGLTITRTIVEAHEGQVWAENNPDGGATLYVTLSACKENDRRESQEITPVTDDAPLPRRHRKAVHLVE